MKLKLSFLIVCIAIGGFIFSFAKSLDFFKKNQSLIKEIDYSLRPQIMQLQLEKSKLNQDLNKVKENLANLEIKFSQSQNDLADAQRQLTIQKEKIEAKDQQISQLTTQIAELKQTNTDLQERFGTVFAEFIKLKKIVSTEEGLKEALVNLKKKQKIVKKINEGLNRREKRRREFENRVSRLLNYSVSEGNRGFLIKDGKSTYVPRVKITVTPVEK